MLTIRLRRMGRKNRAFFRFVVSDSRKAPTAEPVEELGHYDPLTEPPVIQVDRERVDYWVSQGATLSNTVKTLLRRPEAQSETPTAAETEATSGTKATTETQAASEAAAETATTEGAASA